MAYTKKFFEQEDMPFLEPFRLQNPITSEPLKPFIWFVDEERSLYFLGLGGQGIDDIPAYFALIWGKDVIVAETLRKIEETGEDTGDCLWKVLSIEAPAALQGKRDEIKELVKEGLQMRDKLMFPRKTYTVHFTQMAEPCFYEGGRRRWQKQ